MTPSSWTIGVAALAGVAVLDAVEVSRSFVSVQIAVGAVFLAKVIYHATEIVITRRES